MTLEFEDQWEDPFLGNDEFNLENISDSPRLLSAHQRVATVDFALLEKLQSAQESGLITKPQGVLASQHPIIGCVVADYVDDKVSDSDSTPITDDQIISAAINLLKVVVITGYGGEQYIHSDYSPGVNLAKLWNGGEKLGLNNRLIFRALYTPELYATILQSAEEA